MSKRTAHFESGTIIECTCGKSAFKRHVLTAQKFGEGKVWFRNCEAWQKAARASLDEWARSRGYDVVP